MLFSMVFCFLVLISNRHHNSNGTAFDPVDFMYLIFELCSCHSDARNSECNKMHFVVHIGIVTRSTHTVFVPQENDETPFLEMLSKRLVII